MEKFKNTNTPTGYHDPDTGQEHPDTSLDSSKPKKKSNDDEDKEN